ncbi:hypothetical protein PI124_g21396 [Phytophthora idaei]|nr:hypothetical protein PI125_g23999 [Phytophthora idaei]KAG3126939.1 hypothetical protein PI126_g22103 [Phytophthora idaei]KAG3233529.1 hypothetical protein PI124_g21396 [Phytophthora idaei]
MVPAVLRDACQGYRHLDALHEIAASGARVPLARESPQQNSYPASHKSADERYSVLIKSIRKEKNQWRCFVLDVNILELRHEAHISPFGVVNKGDTAHGRSAGSSTI